MITALPLRKWIDPQRPITYGIVQAGPHVPDGVPYIRPVDMTESAGVKDHEALLRTSPEIARAYSRASVATGDVVISIGPSYGKVMIVPDALAGANLTQGTARLAPGPGLDSRWLYWALQSFTCRGFWDAAVGGATFRALNLGPLGETPISAPDLQEQRRTADFLDDQVARVDSVIKMRRCQLDALNGRREAAARAAVTATNIMSRAPSTLAWVDSLPRHWRVARLSLIARMGTGHTPSRSEPEYWVDCTISWVTTGDVQAFRDDRVESLSTTTLQISRLGLANSAAELHPAGTVALSRTASAGFSIVMGVDMATSQDFVTWTCGPLLNRYYLLWVLRAMRPDLLGRLAMGSTHKTIYFPDLESIRVPLPPLIEQEEAVVNIRKENELVNNLSDTIRRSLLLLEERKRSLITAAVTGRFDVSTASSRAAAAAARG